MDFSKLLHGFPKVDPWITLSCYMDLSKLMHGFILIVTWICQSCSMYFSPFVKQNHAKVSRLVKLQLWTKGVEWVKVLNALGPLCLWKCFSWYFRFILPGAAYQNCFYLFTKFVLLLFKWIQNQCFLVWNCSDLDLRTKLWGGGPSGNISFSKGRCQKKTGLCWENSKVAAPPHPNLGNPCYQKKLGSFFILEPQEHFWSSPKNHNSGPRENNCVGNRWPLPPSVGKVYHIFPFFFTISGM